MKRTQIYLEDEQDRWLSARAAETGRTKSELIREAIDRFELEPNDAGERLARFRAAIDSTAAALRPLPRGVDYVASLRGADTSKLDALDRRWRG